MAQKTLNRSEIIKTMSDVYFDFLKSIKWENEFYLKGISEGKNKFLSNAYLSLYGAKHEICNYHSKEALIILSNPELNKSGKLIFEHMVPKQKYIQKPCEDVAIKGGLNKEYIYKLLYDYWFIAMITVEEEKMLKTSKVMPKDWDKKDHKARYNNTKIELIKNPIWVN
jgi:hypothetical protein